MFEEYVSKKLEIQDTGDKGRGYFANENINKGEMLMKSRAICLTVFTNDFQRDYDTLTKQEQENIVQFTSYSQHLYQTLFTGNEQVTKENSLMLKFNFNSYRCQPRLDAAYDYKKALKNPEAGLFLLASIFNHSCVPNCTKYFLGEYMNVIANKDIKQGDELFLGYLENEQNYFNLEGRKKCLSNYFEQCNCELCQFQQTDKYKQLQKRLDYFILLKQKNQDVQLEEVQNFVNLVTEIQNLVDQNPIIVLDGEEEAADYILTKNGNKYKQIVLINEKQNDSQAISYNLDLYSNHLTLNQQGKCPTLLIDFLISIACYGFSLKRPIPLRPETAFIIQKMKYFNMFHRDDSNYSKDDFLQQELIHYDQERFNSTDHIETRYKPQFKKWR